MKIDKINSATEPIEELDKIPRPQNDNTEVPPRAMYGHDLKKLKSFKKIRQSAKMINMIIQFIQDLEPILKFLPPADEENDLDDDILIEVLELAEQHLFYGNKKEREEQKHNSVMHMMLPYFRDDVKILEKSIKNVMHKVKKLSFRRRTWKRWKVCFLSKYKNVGKLTIIREMFISLLSTFIVDLIFKKLIVITPLLILL
jgi:hypothetical protein